MQFKIMIGVLFLVVHAENAVASQESGVGSIRGTIYDADFNEPLGEVKVEILETEQSVGTTGQGNYVLQSIQPGKYTLIFFKPGYVRQIRSEVVVTAGSLTEVNVSLAGEYVDMEEFVVQDALQFDGGTEAALLELRLESPALMDSVSADLMSKAGASDAASALKLVSGATVKDGKSAVVRGLPDRYVSSQLNGVKVPTADEDKRAVELDQFPSAVIESIQVSKTFTPDQQGDASGGAVDVRLKGIPEEAGLKFSGQIGGNSQASGRADFLTYEGGGLSTWGQDDGGRDIQYDLLGENWLGAVGVSTREAPIDSKWGVSGGGKHVREDGLTVGGFGSFFYERDSSFYDNGIDDSWWVDTPGDGMTPETNQGNAQGGDFKTSLFDVAKANQLIQWGGLSTIGVEGDDFEVGATLLYSHTAEDSATLAEETRGKLYYFPDYDVNDPAAPGNDSDTVDAAPWLRLETLNYTERTTGTLQLNGRHELAWEPPTLTWLGEFDTPVLDWTVAQSFAEFYQPDKRQFGALWHADSFNPGAPPFIPPFTAPNIWLPYKPGANFNLGNIQRIWKEIDEDSTAYTTNLKMPFERDGEEGYLKFGLFGDGVTRKFDQESFSNFGDAGANYEGGWDDSWSDVWGSEDHPITESLYDVDYRGSLDISALYAMAEVPLSSEMNVVGGLRFESTGIDIVNTPEALSLWYPPGSSAPVELNAGDADVDFSQDDVLPSIGLNYEPQEDLTLRFSYGSTIARQTFKELSPIIFQEYLGGPIFIGNPSLGMSNVRNIDLRADYRPYDGGFLSASFFLKDMKDPIEYVQRLGDFSYTTAVNYPKGRLNGLELEARHDLGHYWGKAEGLSLGVNATLIDSVVTLSPEEAAEFELPNIQAPMTEREMTNAPEHLFNLYLTYEVPDTETEVALYYNLQGDTLVAGAGQSNGNFVPSIYALEYGTLNLSVSQKLGEYFTLRVQAKNLSNPEIDQVYRSRYIGDDVLHTRYTRGVDYSITFGAKLSF